MGVKEESGGKGPTEAAPGAPVGGDLADGFQAACGSVLLELHEVGLQHTHQNDDVLLARHLVSSPKGVDRWEGGS